MFCTVWVLGFGQKKVHSHNDYEQARPFHLAYEQRVYEIEADVYEVNGELVVAHTKKSIDPKRTLSSLYLKPIDSLFKLYGGRVSKDPKYTFVLMIDFKTEWATTFAVLKNTLEQYGEKFDRSRNKNAVQIVISGNRPPDSLFHTLPKWVFFDGLPNVSYAKADLQRVTMISDNFATYSKWKGIGELPVDDAAKLRQVVAQAHQLKKPFRFWGAPDHEASWKTLLQLGADILNTDKVVECKHFLTDFK